MTNNMGKYMAAALLLLTACQPSTKVKQQEAENDNIQNPIITMRYSADPSARAVSYTHLDVYKRQVDTSIIGPRPNVPLSVATQSPKDVYKRQP